MVRLFGCFPSRTIFHTHYCGLSFPRLKLQKPRDCNYYYNNQLCPPTTLNKEASIAQSPLLFCCRLFNASHYGSSNIATNLTSSNLNLGSLSGSVSPTASNMSACMVQGASTNVPAPTGINHHVTPHSPSEAKSGYPYLGGIESQVCGRVH